MAIREIRLAGDPILNKVCKEVKEISPMIATLIEDMLDTMYEANGVGLAAPQVGILRRIAVIDIGDGPIVLVNPKIIEESGEQTSDEACLAFREKRDRSQGRTMSWSGRLMRIWKNMRWKAMSCWRGHSAMRLSIWTDICTWSM